MKPTQYKKGGKRKKSKGSGKPKPTNPSLWSRAKSLARQKFDVYPSAYANAWAAKWYKSKGGGWRGGSRKKKAEGGFVGFGGPGDPPTVQLPTAEIVGYRTGPNPERLGAASLALKNQFTKDGKPVKEGDRVDFIKNVMGPYSNASWLDPITNPWSAVTTSYLIGNYLGADTPEAMEQMGFRPNAGHWKYISDSFEAAENPDYEYNAYVAQEIPNTLEDVKVGDLFFKGRAGTPNTFKGVQRKARKNIKKGYTSQSSYPSHTDVVVEKGTDSKGEYVVLEGGNVGDTVMREKFYLQDINKDYAGHMKQNPNRNFSKSVMPAGMEDPLADVARSFRDTMPKANGGYMAQMDPSTQIMNQAIMDNQMLAMGIDPEDPYYNRLYQGGGYMNVLAAGGELFAPGGNNDKLTRIDAGGTHEENPLGGVPMGPDASVEEKETIQRQVEPGTDFVFSERLPEGGITPEMAQDEGLPKFVIGKSFAKASKMIEDKSSRSGDILDRNTREVTLARLRDAQEDHKEKEFQNQLAELEDKFGKSAMPMEQPAEQGMPMPTPPPPQGAMPPQMAAQPSPQEMAMMQAGMMGQQPRMQMPHGGPHGGAEALLAGLAQFPSNPEDPNAAYMDLGRAVYGDNNLQQAFDMANALQGSGIPYADPNRFATGPRVGMSPQPTVDPSQINSAGIQEAMVGMGIDPMQASTPVLGETMPGMTPVDLAALAPGIPYATPAGPRAEMAPLTPEEIAFQNSLYQREGFDPVTAYTGVTPTGDLTSGQGDNVDYQVGPDGYHYFPNGLIVDPMTGQAISTSPTPPPFVPPTLDISDQELRDANIKAFGTLDAQGNLNNLVDVPMEEELEPETRVNLDPKDLTLEEFNNPYRTQILSDAGMKFLQGIKPIRERQAADYMLHADYDPILFPIEEQRKAVSNMSAATKKQLSRRVNNPALYLAMAGTIDANESAETAKLFEKKFQVEAADNARIRELLRQDRQANVQMKRLVDELNERDRQGKEQLLIEAANSFSNAYSGFAKEDFYSFMANQYLENADLLAIDTPKSAGGTGTRKQGRD